MANSNVMQGICAPALLYLIFAIISVVIMLFHKFELLSIIVKVLFITISGASRIALLKYTIKECLFFPTKDPSLDNPLIFHNIHT